MKRILQMLVVAGWLVANLASAQFAPLHVGTTNGLVDEFGQMLLGTDPSSDQFGQPVVTGDLVHILRADTNNLVYPPSTNGTPDARNVLVASTRIGLGIDPALGPSGKFSAAITSLNRGGESIKLVARVFNAPNFDQVSFYIDSALYDAPVFGASKYSVFIPQFASNGTTQLLDATDYDGDGLARSWEISYGANPDNPDSDGDGMADGPEIRAGTGVTDPDSLLQMVWLTPMPPPGTVIIEDPELGIIPPVMRDLGVNWDSISGKTYQLEYTTNDLALNPAYLDINPSVTATGLIATTVITNGLFIESAHYRVRLVE